MDAEKNVENVLDDLERTRALQCLNQIDLAELLNPAIESHDMFNVTDKDTFDSVMEVKRLWEGNLGRNPDNDANSDPDSDVSACTPELTCCELLQAALMLQKHIRTLNNPFARKLEMMLGSYGQQTCAFEMQNLKDTKVTDYFSCR